MYVIRFIESREYWEHIIIYIDSYQYLFIYLFQYFLCSQLSLFQMMDVPHRMLQEMEHALQAVNAKTKEEVLVATVLQGNFVLTFAIFPFFSLFFHFSPF